jgi:uncharacterized protein
MHWPSEIKGDFIVKELVDATFSSYHVPVSGGLAGGISEGDPSAKALFIFDSFTSLVGSQHFPCVGAKSAMKRGTMRFGLYGDMLAARSTLGLRADLLRFATEFPEGGSGFATFIACFDGPTSGSEEEFEALLWRQLQELHDLDSAVSDWDPRVSPDPDEADFSFSVGGRAFFVLGLHAAASRWARRFSWPTLVFNPHDQFEMLRAHDLMGGMMTTIRTRDRKLQGTHNPMVDEYGGSSEARQYSGRKVGDDWRCPFRPAGMTP